ncbi:MAG: GNAT family N-acetyltransferase [Bacteroidetes bacterium]|nr:GNAT family N-acetyltransferase [Bacteroidota bacterium]
MHPLLDNPVFNALSSVDSHLGTGTENVKYFDKEVSPYAGIRDEYQNGFEDLHQLLPAGRNILYATRKKISEPKGWKMIVEIEGLQFVFESGKSIVRNEIELVPLERNHVDEMIALAKLTKPGPFDRRTIEFGSYYGIFENEKLVAMTGQRLHIPGFSEVSAVCTHPLHIGKGYAGILLPHQIDIIVKSGKRPFLHVRSDNERAIALYERIGFRVNGPMNFYFLKKA